MGLTKRSTGPPGGSWTTTTGSGSPFASVSAADDSSQQQWTDRLTKAAIQLELGARDYEYFILDAGVVRTEDHADRYHPRKLFPDHLEYLRYLIRWWLGHEKVAVFKSRDVMATLTVTACHFADLIFRDGAQYVFLSDKETKAEYNVQRLWTNYHLLPAEMRYLIPVRRYLGKEGLPHLLQFLPRGPLWPGGPPFHGSMVVAFGQGAKQIETYHPTGIFFDQVETVPQLRDHLASILPVMKPGTRLTMCGTPLPGYWCDIVHDRVDSVEQAALKVA